jgi:uncharacterized protein (DUF2267 family)
MAVRRHHHHHILEPTVPVVRAVEVFLNELRTLGIPDATTPEEATSAVFCVFERRLPGGLAMRLQEKLPEELRGLFVACPVFRTAPAEAFGRAEFLRRVAAHLGCGEPDAEQAARSVLVATRRVVASRELFRDVDRELPRDLRELWEAEERV